MTVELTEAEWNQVISILAQAPWSVANPLLVRITTQLQGQKTTVPLNPNSNSSGKLVPEDEAGVPTTGRH